MKAPHPARLRPPQCEGPAGIGPVGCHGIAQTASPGSSALHSGWGSFPLLLAPLVVALLLWVRSLTAFDLDAMTDLGLVAVFPLTYVIALALLVVGFGLTLAAGARPAWLPAVYVAGWVAVIHATPAILYGSLRYAWAWKHVGIVDYILRTGGVDPAIDSLGVYHNWPGFFGAAALLTEVAGTGDALVIATWAPFAFELLFAALVLFVLRACTGDHRLVWTGVWVFSLANWVGQDYFAPQAMTYAAYLALIGLCLRAFPGRAEFSASPIGRTVGRLRLAARAVTALDRLSAPGIACGTARPALAPHQRRGLLAIAIVLMAAIAVSHQLTPIMTTIALGALVVSGRCRVWWLPVLMLLFTVAWFVTGASNYATEGLRQVIASFGQPRDNIDANLIDPSQFSEGTRLVSSMTRALTAAVGILTVAGWLRRLRRGTLDVSPMVLWIAPAFLLGASNYGGEILFRVYFYALPFMAFFVAALVFPSPETATGWKPAVLASGLSLILGIGFLFAYFGHDRISYFRPGEVAAAAYLAEHAPPDSLVVEVSPNYPSRYRNYEFFTHVPLVAWARGNVSESQNAYTVAEIEQMMADPQYAASYLIVTRSQLAELSRPGLASVTGPLAEIAGSARFVELFVSDDATIYALSDRTAGSAP